MSLSFRFWYCLTGRDGVARKGFLCVPAASCEREADVKAAEALRNAGLLRVGDELRLRCLERS